MFGGFIIAGVLVSLSHVAVAQELNHSAIPGTIPSSIPQAGRGSTYGGVNPCAPARTAPVKPPVPVASPITAAPAPAAAETPTLNNPLRFEFPGTGYVVEYDATQRVVLVTKNGNPVASYQCNDDDVQKCLADQKSYWQKLFSSLLAPQR